MSISGHSSLTKVRLQLLPTEVFRETCRLLNIDGPCHWKHLVQLIQQENPTIFSVFQPHGPVRHNKIYAVHQVIRKTSADLRGKHTQLTKFCEDCRPFNVSHNEVTLFYSPYTTPHQIVAYLSDKHLTVGFLLHHLTKLPCNCTSQAFKRSLDLYASQQSGCAVMSIPNYPHHSSLQEGNVNYGVHHTYDGPQLQHLAPAGYQSVPGNMIMYYNPCQPQHTNMRRGQPLLKITDQPKDHQVTSDDAVMLRVAVHCSSSDISYQWYHNDRPVIDGQNKLMIINNPTVSDEGVYYCIASIRSMANNPDAVVRSENAFVQISVSPAPHVSEFCASDKIALLIGNDHYHHNRRLPAVSRDVRVLTKIFKDELHFKTLSFVNLNWLDTHRALQLFLDLCSSGCYCVFYFGGHGYENDGKCNLVPTDAPYNYNGNDCIQAYTELENIQRRCKPKMMLILLDICRKRNPNDSTRDRTSNTLLGNVVFAYATTENREAYEEKGEKHGIFVDSLRRHLTKRVRVTHMLEFVQADVSKSSVQVVEVKSSLSHNICLTDRLQSSHTYPAVHNRWSRVHDVPKLPILIQCTDIGRSFELRVNSILSNCVELQVSIPSGEYPCGWEVYIKVDRLRSYPIVLSDPEGYDLHSDAEKQPSVQIANLHQLQDPRIPVSFLVIRKDLPNRPGNIYTYQLDLAFVRTWQGLRQSR